MERYAPIKQLPFCCVPACISMVLDRRNISYGSQEEIGYQLGLAVPKEFSARFPKARFEKPASGWGTEIQKDAYSLNNFFKKNSFPLKETGFFVDEIRDPKKFLIDNLSKNKDIIVCFNYRVLYGDMGDCGHVSLIEDLEGEYCVLIEPEEGLPDRRKVKLSKLIGSIEVHGKDNRAGFWVIESAANN